MYDIYIDEDQCVDRKATNHIAYRMQKPERWRMSERNSFIIIALSPHVTLIF